MPELTPALSPAQEQVIALLSAGATLAAAAQAAGVHRNTIANWRRTQPLFGSALAAAQYDRLLHWRDLAEEHAGLAIQTIRDLLADPNTPPSIRLKAALALLKECTALPPAPPVDGEFRRHVEYLARNAAAASPDSMHNPAQPFRRPLPKIGRNEPCACGSGRKYKQCCLNAAA